ncbi:hypothetical protein BC941DRAFT_261622 [Chlamydoabsidia padenii]|nr:hypothetical protein BC941DRAFT_261622 [Chlamydoabsidia padenii]
MVAQPTTPFSALLHQLLSTTSVDTSSKGKRKANSAASRFFSAETPVISTTTTNQDTVDAFCKLIEQQSTPEDSKRKTSFGQDIPFTPPVKTWFDFGKTQDSSSIETAGTNAPQQQQMDQPLLETPRASLKHVDVYDRDWLLKQSKDYVNSRENGGLSAPQLCADMFTILRSGASDDDIQASLVDLLGYDALDLIAVLITNRSKLVSNIMNMSEHVTQTKQKQQTINTPMNPVYGTQIIVQSEDEVRKRKQQRKEQKKASKAQNRDKGKSNRYTNWWLKH